MNFCAVHYATYKAPFPPFTAFSWLALGPAFSSHVNHPDLIFGSSAPGGWWALRGLHFPVPWPRMCPPGESWGSPLLFPSFQESGSYIPLMAWKQLPEIFLSSFIIVFWGEASLGSLTLSCLEVESTVCPLISHLVAYSHCDICISYMTFKHLQIAFSYFQYQNYNIICYKTNLNSFSCKGFF